MSEATEVDNETGSAAASEAEVNEAFEELVRNVDVPDEKPAAKKRVAKTAKKPTASANVDSLVESVSSLVRSVEALTERIPVAGAAVSGAVVSATAEPVTDPAPVEAEVPVELQAEEMAEDATSDDGPVSLKTIALENVLTIATFLGLGLVAFAVMGSGVIAVGLAVVGIAMFVASSVLQDRSDVLRVAGGSVAFALGIGMVVGGVQFFGDEPKRAAVLIPVGVPLLMAGLVLRKGWKLSTEHISWIAGAAVWSCLGLFIGLNALAGSMTEEEVPAPPAATAGGDHGEAGEQGAAGEGVAGSSGENSKAAASEHDVRPAGAAGDHDSVPTAGGDHGEETQTAGAEAATGEHGEEEAPVESSGVAAAAPAKVAAQDVKHTVEEINKGSH